jgi:hypothetical protein
MGIQWRTGDFMEFMLEDYDYYVHIINSYIPSVNETVCKLENDHRNSGFTHGKW